MNTSSHPASPLEVGPTERPPLARPELLAPAGDWDCARAAVENGADAIYFGLERFNARMRAHNFTLDDLPELIRFLHHRGVRGYVTFNTLIFEAELELAKETLLQIIRAGVDAAIVQDVGICRLIRSLSPDFPIHVSTQMTVTSSAGVDFARQLGAQVVVLARECSLKEIARIRTEQAAKHSSAPLPLEIFVHGALCVAYSGQCLTSEALGGRSANRGECAQACRLPYELICDGRLLPLGDRRYLLSPQDLASLELLPEIIQSGVASLKIEGRLKTPEYVASITRVYREALDSLFPASCAGSVDSRTEGTSPESGRRLPRYEMEMSFSRGLSTGWLRGINNQALVHAQFSKKRGVLLGTVTQVRHDGICVRLDANLKPGDGVVFESHLGDSHEQGGRVYAVRPRGSDMLLTFASGALQIDAIREGARLWKTSDPELERSLQRTYEGATIRFRRPISLRVVGTLGEPLQVIAHDSLGHHAEVRSRSPLIPAAQHPLTADRLRQQLGRLGSTPYRLGELSCELSGNFMLPVSELNEVRRQFVSQLDNARTQSPRWHLHDPSTASQPSGAKLLPGHTPSKPELSVLIRHPAQLEPVLRAGVAAIYCEFEDPKRYRSTVEQFRSDTHRSASTTIWLAPPRVFKPGEEWILKQVRSAQPDGYLARNFDHLDAFRGERLRGDFSLNVANHLSAAYFLESAGLQRVTASYDLDVSQLEALLQAGPANQFEITLHQPMPMFHMEHCLFCAFLSSGTDYTNCGRPCDTHDLKLRDRTGAEHPVKADAGCRNTVFNSRAQTGAAHLDRLRAVGASQFRIDLLNESALEAGRIVQRYQALLDGSLSFDALWREFNLLNQLGVTRGQLR